MNNYKDLQPVEVFKWFNEISNIPRCSGDEQRVSDFLVKFAISRNLEYYQDEEKNVIIKKPATSGYEDYPTVIIQGHMDMVCEKRAESSHDFTCDPIIWEVKEDHLYAVDTTLGGDDGIAVSYALAILDSNSIKHPNIEVLITTNEETGMDGANGVDGKLLNGEILLNIDAEDEGVFLASCSGGANSFVKFNKEFENVENKIALKIDISGLLGGHSGMEIHKQRANSIKLLGRILYNIGLENEYYITELIGGSKHNAIANNGYVTIAVNKEDKEKVIENVEAFTKIIKDEFKYADPNINITVEELGTVDIAYSKGLSTRLTEFMCLIINGVKDMDLNIEGLVQSSSNVGVIINNESSIIFMSCVRSSVDSILQEELREIEVIGKLLNAEVWVEKEYPAWQFADDSKIRNLAISTFEELFDKLPEISAAHCGLETGIIKAIKPNLDILSYGPDLMDVHTFNEHLSISSVSRVWDFTKKILENIKDY